MGTVARACNPSYLGGWGRRIAWTQEAEERWAKIAPLHSSLGNKSETPSQKKNLCVTAFFSSFKSYSEFAFLIDLIRLL